MTRDEQIIVLYREGYTSSYVAKSLGLTTGLVAAVVGRAGIKRRTWGKNPDRPVRSASPEKHRAVVADRFAGLTYPQIAEKHGLPTRTCWRLVNERAL